MPAGDFGAVVARDMKARATREEVRRDTDAHPSVRSLIAGTEDEVFLLSSGATATPDTVNYRVGGQGWRLSSTNTGTLSASVNGPIGAPPFQAVGLWVYVPDPSVITDIGLYLYFSQDLAAANRFWRAFKAHSPQTPIVQGWNFFRIPADLSIPGVLNRGTIWRASVYAVTTSTSASITIGHLYLETPPKARMVMIADRGYQDFYSGLYQHLKARQIPVTFAVDVTLFGTGTGRTLAMSEALMHEVARENGNSISFHGWDGAPTSTMTAAQLRADTAKAVKWLQTHGYSGRMWRAAYVQGSAPAWESARGLLVGSASGTGPSRPNAWPPQDMHNIYRYALDNTATTASIDAWFDWLKATHMTDLVFVHSESTATVDYTPELRTHFLARVDQALAEGWLSFETFESLFRAAGGRWSEGGGSAVAEWTDAQGARTVKHLL